MIKAASKEFSKILKSGTGKIHRYYFSKGLTTKESPLISISLYGLFAALFLSFLISGLSPNSSLLLALSGLGWFSFFTILHIFLWFVGSIYRVGVHEFISTGIMIIGMALLLIIVGGFILFGWSIPLFGFIIAYHNFVPEPLASWLKPLMIIFIIIFALVWYSIGISYFDKV